MRGCLVILSLLMAFGCARSPIKSPTQAFRKKEKAIQVADDLGQKSFYEGVNQIIEFYKNRPNDTMNFGAYSITRGEYLKGLTYLRKISETPEGFSTLNLKLLEHFHALEVYGEKEWGDVFITSYYQPVIEGRLKKEKQFSYPIYELPEDLVTIKMREFIEQDPNLRAAKDIFINKSRNMSLSGKLKQVGGKSFVAPYYTRKQIDENDQAISKVIAWVDPIDAFFLHIQGSGVVQLKDKKIRVGYAGQNGHKYFAIGRDLKDVIPIEEMSMQRIKEHLQTLTHDEMMKVLHKNPSYVFFREIETEAKTYSGSELIQGRTIATDPLYFPKGSLALVEFNKPEVSASGQDTEVNWSPTQRLVFDQDTGGAIRGPGRLDLYWGEGAVAAQHAGIIKERGRLYYFVPKQSFLDNFENLMKEGEMKLGQAN